MQRYIGNVVDTPQLGALRIRLGCVIDVSPDGAIKAITSSSDEAPKIPEDTLITILAPFTFLLPTFTDLHIHPAQYLYSGTGLDLPLMEWLGKYAYQAEEKLDKWAVGSEEERSRVRKAFEALAERLVEEGTGAILAFGTIAIETNLILAHVCQEMGLRAHIGKLSMDLSSRPTYCEASASASISSLRLFIDQMRELVGDLPIRKRLVHPVITPRFVPTSSDDLLRELSTLTREPAMADVLIQSHMCESWDQEEWVKAVKGKEDHEVFHEHGLLTDRTIQAHVTGLTADNMELVHTTGTSIAHCPLSNVYFSDKQFPLREAIDRRLTVGLGSDIAGGYSPSIQVNMRQAVTTARNRESRRVEALRDQEGSVTSSKSADVGSRSLRVTWKESLYLATKGGAQALKQAGEIAVGAPFDVQQINLVDPATITGVGSIDFLDDGDLRLLAERLDWWETAIEKWWCVGDVRNRSGVWVQGRRIR